MHQGASHAGICLTNLGPQRLPMLGSCETGAEAQTRRTRPTHREIWSWQPLSLRCACGVACARRHQRAARRARQPISLSTHVACAKKHRCAGSLARATQRWRKRREGNRQSQWSEAGTRRHIAASTSALRAQAMTLPHALEVQTHNGPIAQRLARSGRLSGCGWMQELKEGGTYDCEKIGPSFARSAAST